MKWILFVALGGALLSVPALGQDEPPPPAQDTPPAEDPPAEDPPVETPAKDGEGTDAAPPVRRDPTVGSVSGPWTNPTRTGRAALPKLALKARVLVKGKPPVALIQVDDSLFVVREGSTVTVSAKRLAAPKAPRTAGRQRQPTPAVGPTTLSLTVTRLDAQSIEIDVPGHGALVLR